MNSVSDAGPAEQFIMETVALGPQSNPQQGEYHASLIVPEMERAAQRQGTWQPSYKPARNMTSGVKMECDFDPEHFRKNAAPTSLVTDAMMRPEAIDEVRQATLRPTDNSNTLIKSTLIESQPKWLDQVQQARMFQAKPQVHSFNSARRPLDPGYDNDFTHLMRSGYQHDFNDVIADRTVLRTRKEKVETARFAKGDKKSAENWMKTRKNPLLTPAQAKQEWIVGDKSYGQIAVEVKPLWHMKKFSNVTSKLQTGKVKRTANNVASGYQRKGSSGAQAQPTPPAAAVAKAALPSNQQQQARYVPPAVHKPATPQPNIPTQPW